MPNTTNKIIKLSYYACGYCTNNLKHMFKNHPTEKRHFPAGVFLVEHVDYGYVLYDTGYSKEIYKGGVIDKLYNTLNPVTVTEEDHIDVQLKQDFISTNDIKYVVLSHLHPDHIGGLKFFPNATFIVSQKTMQTLRKKKKKDLIMNRFIPKDFFERVQVIDTFNNTTSGPFPKVYDLFQDKSILLIELDGHTLGQTCMYLSEINTLIAADVVWGVDLLDYSDQLKMLPRMIQKDHSLYLRSIEVLKQLKNDGTTIYVTHDSINKKVLFQRKQ